MAGRGEEFTTDRILGGRVILRQPAKGYRAAIDPVLLAAFTPALFGERVLEIGCGTGAAILALNARMPGLQLTAVEPDAALRALAIENAALNGAALDIVEGAIGGDWPISDNAFDHVICNPPFYSSQRYAPSPFVTRTQAHELRQPLALWVKAAKRALAGEGMLTMIISAGQIPELLGALHGQLGKIVMLPVMPHPYAYMTRMLVRAQLNRKTAPAMRPPLVLHLPEDGGYTPEVEAILRDGAAIL